MSRRTWRRWMSGEARIPLAVVRLARILQGELGEISPAWSDWILNTRTGELADPDGVRHTPQSVQVWHWTAQQLRGLRGEENKNEKIRRIRTGRDAHVVTLQLHQRLKNGSQNFRDL